MAIFAVSLFLLCGCVWYSVGLFSRSPHVEVVHSLLRVVIIQGRELAHFPRTHIDRSIFYNFNLNTVLFIKKIKKIVCCRVHRRIKLRRLVLHYIYARNILCSHYSENNRNLLYFIRITMDFVNIKIDLFKYMYHYGHSRNEHMIYFFCDNA